MRLTAGNSDSTGPWTIAESSAGPTFVVKQECHFLIKMLMEGGLRKSTVVLDESRLVPDWFTRSTLLNLRSGTLSQVMEIRSRKRAKLVRTPIRISRLSSCLPI